jgi:hypothetical protein
MNDTALMKPRGPSIGTKFNSIVENDPMRPAKTLVVPVVGWVCLVKLWVRGVTSGWGTKENERILYTTTLSGCDELVDEGLPFVSGNHVPFGAFIFMWEIVRACEYRMV